MRAAGLSLLAILLLPGTGTTQIRARIDAGLGGPGSWSLAPELWFTGARTRVELGGEYRDYSGSGRGAAGLVTGSWFRPLRGPVTLELTGTARGQSGVGLTTAGAWWAGPRLHLSTHGGGVWFGLAAGREPPGSTLRWEGTAWKNLGQLSIQLQGSQTATSLRQSNGPDTLGGFPDTLANRTGRRLRTTTDLGLWLRWGANRTELAFASGMRFGLSEPALALSAPGGNLTTDRESRTGTASSAWWLAEGTYWLADRVGLVGTVGRQPPDPAFATRGRTFFRLAFRAALQRRRQEPVSPVAPRSTESFRFNRLNAGLVEFTLAAPGAERVEIMGDFSDWLPVSMERLAGDRWRIRLRVIPGLHRVNVRYDGGSWFAPPSTRVVRDEFGEESGELLIG